MRTTLCVVCTVSTVLVCGCSTLVERTDRAVYRVIEERQLAALGETHDARIADAPTDVESSGRMYRFNPRSLDPGIPDSFIKNPDEPAKRARGPAGSAGETGQQPQSKPEPTDDLTARIFSDQQLEHVTLFDLRQAMAYAMHHARDFQDAKEELYLAALDLTLERHLWTPQFEAIVRATYDDAKDDVVMDRALTTISNVSVRQDLPFGGHVGATVIHELVRDVRDRVSRAETGQVILDANVPLLRGAGRVAYETRYRKEREMVYAIRDFERFRRSFLVDVAQRYFDLQLAKASIHNTFKKYLSQRQESEKADCQFKMARIDISQASRVKSSFRRAAADLVTVKERYESALDRFKIRIGMSVGALLDVMTQEKDESANAVDALLPDVTPDVAIAVALHYRLDLLNSADQWDDARRGVVNAKNNILPDLDFRGSVAFDSDPNRLRGTRFQAERRAWQGLIELRLDDRKTEQNAYRDSQIQLRRAQRRHEEFQDIVRADTRRALRQIAQQDNLKRIEAINVRDNELRLEAAKAHFDLGKKTNQDVVDTEADLLIARNQLARAMAAYRSAILDFRLDTGTLRVTDEGNWQDPRAFGLPGREPSGTNDGS